MTRLFAGEERIYNAGIHWFILTWRGFGQFVLALLPYGLYLALGKQINLVIPPSLTDIVALVYLIWLIILWIGFFYIWTDYYLDRWIITDQRIIDIEQRGMFNRDEASILYEHIQDVVVETKGFWATVFDIGDVHIQTAGTEKEVVFENMGYPYKVRDLIISLQHADIED